MRPGTTTTRLYMRTCADKTPRFLTNRLRGRICCGRYVTFWIQRSSPCVGLRLLPRQTPLENLPGTAVLHGHLRDSTEPPTSNDSRKSLICSIYMLLRRALLRPVPGSGCFRPLLEEISRSADSGVATLKSLADCSAGCVDLYQKLSGGKE